MAGLAFYQVDLNFDSGVLQRVGLFFFLGTYFMLTSLVSLPMWQHERLIYFQEWAAGCYSSLSYILSKLFFDLVPLRLLPALLCAAILYPLVGLRHDGPNNGSPPQGPIAAAMFVTALCLFNLVATAMTTIIGLGVNSSSVASFLGVLLCLFTLLFSGVLVNQPTLQAHGGVVGMLPYLSFLYYFIELALYNEIYDKTITIQPRDGDLARKVTADGKTILSQLGYAHEPGFCFLGMPCASLRDLEVLGLWALGAVVLCYVVLRFCVRDPH